MRRQTKTAPISNCRGNSPLLTTDDIRKLELLRPHLLGQSTHAVQQAVRSTSALKDPALAIWADDRHACFYAPFDWVNEKADIVLIGITPGLRQAEDGLVAMQKSLKGGNSIEQAAETAKLAASFNGEMREIGALLMDYFGLQRLFGLKSTAELFGGAAACVHYTSVLRYPVLEWDRKNNRWKNYGGDDKITKRPEMKSMIDRYLIPELRSLSNAWLVPFGPTPAKVLDLLVQRGEIDGRRILAGLNHPSGTHWNRHNCQLDRVDHCNCATNVGCGTIQERGRALRAKVAELEAAGAGLT